MGDCGTHDPTRQAGQTRRSSSRGEHAGSPEYDFLSASELLPHDVLPKSTVYDAFSQWRDDGTWAKMVKALREQTRVAVGREPPRARRVSRANRSRRPRWEGPSVAMLAARKSQGASGMCW